MRALLLCLLVGCGLVVSEEREPRQVYGSRISLQPSHGGYLPPVGHGCTPSILYRTKVVYSTVVIPSTIFNNDVQIQTQTSIQVQQVFSTVFSDITNTQGFPQVQFQTITVTRTEGNVQTQFVTQPGQFNVVTQTRYETRTETQFQTQFETRDTQVASTFTREVISTQVVPQQIFSTIFRTETITRTQELPGQTRTIDSTLYSTVYSTVVVPGQNVVSTLYVTRTNYITQTITQPGQTQVITSTQFNPLTSTSYSDIVVTNTQTVFITRTQFQQQVTTVLQTQQNSQQNTRTVTITQQVVNTQFSTQVIPTTIFSQQTIPTVVNLPGQTQYQTIFRTFVRTIQLPGLTRTLFQTRTLFNTNYITSTVFNRHFITITAARTVKPYCKTHGYGYARTSPTHSPYGPH